METLDRAEQALRDLVAELRRHEPEGSVMKRSARSGRIPEDLADDDNRWLSLDADEEAALQAAVAVLAEDLRFEHITDADERLWRFVCISALGRHDAPIEAFVSENQQEPIEKTCFFPIELLTVDRAVETLGIRLLPPTHADVPPEQMGFSLGEPIGSVAAVQVMGTNLRRMRDRAVPIVDRALSILRFAIQAERGVSDLQLRFRRGEGYSFGDRLVGWERRAEAGVSLSLDEGLIDRVNREPVAMLVDGPQNDLEQRADRALRWIEDATLATDPVEELLFLCFALEALLGRKDEGLKARGLAFRRAMLSSVVRGSFAHPQRALWLYEDVRSAAVHGEHPPEIPRRDLVAFAWDVRNALSEYLEFAAAKNLKSRRSVLRCLARHPDHERLIDWLAQQDPSWGDLLRPARGDATVSEIFPPDDRVALFVESMTQAANDVEYALRQSGKANPDGALPDVSVRRRFGFWVRLVYGFLFEAVVALRAWEEELEVRRLLERLSPDVKALLKEVRRLREQLGSTAIETVRQHTFHYPHPHAGKQPDSTEALADVLRSATELTAAIDLRDDSEHTFVYADQIALGLAMSGHHDPDDPKFNDETGRICDGAVSFVGLVKGLYVAYFEDQGYGFRQVEHP